MARPFQPGVVSANHLITGRVIYMDACGQWVGRMDQAELIGDQARADARLALAAAQPDTAVGAYIAPALSDANDRPAPAHFRESFRANGPSEAARIVREAPAHA